MEVNLVLPSSDVNIKPDLSQIALRKYNKAKETLCVVSPGFGLSMDIYRRTEQLRQLIDINIISGFIYIV